MASSPLRSSRVPALVKAAGGLGLVWAIAIALVRGYEAGIHAILRAAWKNGWLSDVVGHVASDCFHDTVDVLRWTTAQGLLGLTLLVPLAMLVRMVARARARAGEKDPLDRMRDWITTHARGARAVLALPSLAWVALTARHVWQYTRHWSHYFTYVDATSVDALHRVHLEYGAGMGVFTCLMAAMSLLIYPATRAGLRAFLAPTLEETDTARVSERRIGFDAVAVTTETRAAVAMMAVLPLFAYLAIQVGHLRDTGILMVLTAYVAVALGGALAFRRASRVAIGVDGIYVTGTSRSRFFAYRDLDAVRARGSDIELVRRGKVVVRLQLHGEDATQRDAIVLRVEEAIARAKERETASIGEMVVSASPDKLARLADGAEGYRSPSVTRLQLWSLVEGPEHDADTRTSAAKALVAKGDESERVRLRVAADQCAEPRARVALMDLARDGEETEDEEEDVVLTSRVRRAESR